MTQVEALNILKTGANVFLTGEPGSGKTHTINEYVVYLRKHGVEPAITASTGIAATHIGGMTIHSWSGLGIKTDLSPYELDKLATNEHLCRRINRANVLIIDEISMLTPTMLTMVDAVCREIRQNQGVFGGMQVIFVGDFFQLPPVSKTLQQNQTAPSAFNNSSLFKGEKASFAYQSSAWQRAKPIVCYLHEQHRQSDKQFLQFLSALRADEMNEDHYELIKERFVDEKEKDKKQGSMTKLFSHNADVDRVNAAELEKLPGEPKKFSMTSMGSEKLVASMKKSCLSPELLELKKNAVVLFTKNNPNKHFANGTQGKVVDFDTHSGFPVVETTGKIKITVEPMEWNIEENGKIRASITQIPLRLAWAITVHKSQGMSLDSAVMDLSRVFEYGQGYVALSRVRTLGGLHLLGINANAFKVHPEILEVDKKFKEKSEEAENAFAEIPVNDLAKMHQNFLLASSPIQA